MNKIEEKVKTYLRQYLLVESGMHVCVCFSGGMDSSVLLWILYRFRDEFNIRLSACHFNHLLRGSESDQDALFCQNVCQKLHIPFFYGSGDVLGLQKNSALSLEEAGREARYSWFESIAEEQGIDRFATAHHKNDQAETVLFRLIRGTTVSGLAGIPILRDRYIRPLLCLTKDEIQSFALQLSIEFRTDSTNLSDVYTRNYIRKNVLPAIEKVNSSAVDAIARLSAHALEDDAFIASLLPRYAEMQDLGRLPMPIVRRTVARNYHIFCGDTLCYQHLDQICDALIGGGEAKIGLPGDRNALVKRGYLSFDRISQSPLPVLSESILTSGVSICCDGRIRITFGKYDDNRNKHFIEKKENVYNLSTEIPLSYEQICGMIRFRARRQGDRIRVRGTNRSVKKLFSEHRIPVFMRDSIPVFYDDEGILYIPFVAVSDRVYSSKEQAQFFLRVEIENEHTRKVVEEQ